MNYIKTFLCSIALLSTCSYADSNCSVKLINSSDIFFEKMGIRATIGNLYLSICSQNPRRESDKKTMANCSANPANTIYTHPLFEATCDAINGWPVYIQLEHSATTCYSKPQATKNRDVELNFPSDFVCAGISKEER